MTDSLALYSARRGLGILGGTFDPVHAGHLCLARAALDAVPLVRVELMPAGEPWQKSRISPGIHRLNMLRIAVEYEPQCRINTSELCRSGATYTIDTVSRLREEVGPDMPLVLILGSDQWFNLSTWREWQSLTDFVHIAYCQGRRARIRNSRKPGPLGRAPHDRGAKARLLAFGQDRPLRNGASPR